ncbi:hypothetical protein MHBO_005066, partial [Bonamia ostreae]
MAQNGVEIKDVIDVKRETGKILFAYDESDHSKIALQKLIQYHLKPGDELYILNVHPEMKAVSQLVKDKSNYEATYMKKVALIKSVAAMIEAKHNVQTFSIVKIGEAREVIRKAISEFGITQLILGSRGLGNIKGMLLGSVSSYCVRQCNCT